MPRTPAKLTQADVARCIRAAKSAGAECVAIHPDGSITVSLGTKKFLQSEINYLDPESKVEL